MVVALLLAGLAPAAAAASLSRPIVVWAVGDGPNPYPDTHAKQVVGFLQSEEPFDDLLWLGDIYDAPTDKAFDKLYGSTYGRFAKQGPYPTPGNHELKARRPLGPYDDYWKKHRPSVIGGMIHKVPSNLYAADLGNGWRLSA